MPIPSIEILQPPGPTVFQSRRAPPFDAESNPSVPSTFLAALAVRFPVFVHEQKCSAAEEIDKDDPISWHWVVYVRESGEQSDKVAAGTIRLVPVQPLLKHGEYNDKSEEKKEEEVKQALGPKHERTEMWDGQEAFLKLGRMATLKEYRKLGLGRLLVDTAVEWLEQNHEEVVKEMEVDGAAKNTDEVRGKWNGLVLVHAQKEIERFWGSCGFVRDDGMGEWWEEGIVHIAMWRIVTVK